MNDKDQRIYKTARYIERNLNKDLLLDDLAAMACFSSFHYQRVFKEVIGETPKQYVKRLRLEEAAHRIVLYPEKSILEVALSVGFQSLEAFSRAFKDYYSISPDNFRKSNEKEKMMITGNANRNRVQLDERDTLRAVDFDNSNFVDLEIEIIKQPARKFVYCQTSIALPQQITESFTNVRKWAFARDIASHETQPFGLIKDFPLFTALDKCRYLACIPVVARPAVSGKIGYDELPARTYVAFRIKGSISHLVNAATFIAHRRLPETGYRITMEPALQIPRYNPLTTPFDENEYQILLCVQPE